VRKRAEEDVAGGWRGKARLLPTTESEVEVEAAIAMGMGIVSN